MMARSAEKCNTPDRLTSRPNWLYRHRVGATAGRKECKAAALFLIIGFLNNRDLGYYERSAFAKVAHSAFSLN